MKNLQTMKHSVQKGFTLIELMIVVAIIGILAALAIPAYSDYTIKAKISEAASLTGAMKAAVEVYYSEQGDLPDFTSYANSQEAYDDLGVASNFTGKYASSVKLGTGAKATPSVMGSAGTIEVVIHGFKPDSNPLNGAKVLYIPDASAANITWSVGTNIGRSTEEIPQKYLPKT